MLGARLVCIVAFIFVFSFFAPLLLRLVGIPNLVPLIRDILLIILAFSAVPRIKFQENRLFYGSVLFAVLIIIFNALIAVFDNHQIEGIYYARVYALPLLFAVACRGWLLSAEKEVVLRVVKLTYTLCIIVLIIAIPFYIATVIDISLLISLTGENSSALTASWFIAGGWLRMGLPMVSPNHLGVLVTLFFLFLASIQFSGTAYLLHIRRSKVVFLLMGIVLILTFSRSSWLAVVFGTVTLLFACRREWNIGAVFVMRVSLIIVIGLVFFSILIYFVDDYSDGVVSNWFSLSLSGKDPSMVGHGSSFTEAWDTIDEYYLYGYPRGSVGGRALVAREDMKNVENSILILFYDMGISIGIFYIVFSSLIISCLFRHSSQIAMIIAFAIPGMLLPYVFAPEIVIIFLFMYSILGSFMEKTRYIKYDKTTKKAC
jgi:hypothetical protein